MTSREDTVKAFILAGGLGTRLLPLTEHLPKPLLPFANIPLAKHTMRLLKHQGINEFVFLLHHQPDKFPEVLGDGHDAGCSIKYVSFSENFGTAGCVKQVEKEIDQTALIFSGDIIADIDIDAMLKTHRQRRAQISLAIRPEPLPSAFGVVQADSRGRIIRFHEKPTQAELFSNWINCGIYLVEPGFLKNFSGDRPLSFEREVFPSFAENRKPIYGFPLAGYWRDMGTPASYLRTHEDFLDGKLPAVYYQCAPHTARAHLIGAGVVIDGSSRIERSVIGDGCVIEKDTELRNCVLWDGVRVGRGAKLSECIVGSNARVDSGTEASCKSIVAEENTLPSAAYIETTMKNGVDHSKATTLCSSLAVKAA